jgi:hypothetical protein
MASTGRFWAIVGFAVGLFWITAYVLLFTAKGPILWAFGGAMFVTSPASFVLFLFTRKFVPTLFLAPFLNALTYGVTAHWWINRKGPAGPPSIKTPN